ncbi:MAG: hypothetical protein QW520_03195 [Methanomassiliicoccales archaeon]
MEIIKREMPLKKFIDGKKKSGIKIRLSLSLAETALDARRLSTCDNMR